MANQKKYGIIISYVSQLVHILTNIIYVPIMLRILGKSEYGLYQLAAAVVSNLSILSMGFSSAYIRFYSKEKEKKNEQGISRLNGMFMTIFLVPETARREHYHNRQLRGGPDVLQGH